MEVDSFILYLGDEPAIGDETMDLAAGIGQLMLTETAGNIQAANRIGRDGAVTANNVLQFAAARNFDEKGVTEGRTESAILATPVAGPTTQQP